MYVKFISTIDREREKEKERKKEKKMDGWREEVTFAACRFPHRALEFYTFMSNAR